MNEPLPVSAVVKSVRQDGRRAWAALVVYEVLFKLLEAWLFLPAVAVALSAVLSRAGHVAVSNRDVLDFLLSPSGLLYAALFGTAAVALVLLEQAGIMALAGSGEHPSVWQALRTAFLATFRVLRLAALLVALLALTLAPFALLALVTYHLLLSRHDVNFYLENRPPAFWLAAGIGIVLLLVALVACAWLYVRWAFALPIVLFEKQPAFTALGASRDRVRGAGWRVGLLLVGWLLAALLLGIVLEAGFQLFAAAVLDRAGERPTALILVLLVAQAGLLAAVSALTVVGLGLLTRRLYQVRSERLGISAASGAESMPGAAVPPSPWTRRLAYLAVALVLLAPLALWADLPRRLADRPPVQVTAHRGHSLAAPENTLSAVRKAIASGADYAEVDVQLTADGVVVLLHDRDLKRVAGVPRRIEEVTRDEVRKLDVGGWFGPTFVGERVPTLAEVIALSRERIKLNVELKLYGPDRGLAREVARLVREKDFESDCLVTSFSYDAVLELKRQNTRLRTGLIVAHALGDVSRLEVEALSVRADWLSDELLRSAHRAGKEVHVWTVNDAGQMTRLIKRGVDNIITDDPDLAIRVRHDWASLTGAERLLLASRLLLGLNP